MAGTTPSNLDGPFDGKYNSIGTGEFPFGDNIFLDEPLLGPRRQRGADETHALLAGSPAIDSGDPTIAYDPAAFDQHHTSAYTMAMPLRRAGNRHWCVRVATAPGPAPGDYNLNGTVDSADYVVWRKTLSLNVTPFSGEMATATAADQDDYGVWRAHFATLCRREAEQSRWNYSSPPSFKNRARRGDEVHDCRRASA